jgi:hypothetical protein
MVGGNAGPGRHALCGLAFVMVSESACPNSSEQAVKVAGADPPSMGARAYGRVRAALRICSRSRARNRAALCHARYQHACHGAHP